MRAIITASYIAPGDLPDLAGDAKTTSQAMSAQCDAECTLASARNLLRWQPHCRQGIAREAFAALIPGFHVSVFRLPPWRDILSGICKPQEECCLFRVSALPDRGLLQDVRMAAVVTLGGKHATAVIRAADGVFHSFVSRPT